MTLRILTRRLSPRIADGERTHFDRVPIDLAAAERQHAAYRTAMVAAGAELVDLPPLAPYPDSTFVEDALIALAECFILCRPGAASRRGEVEALAPHVPGDRPTVRIVPPGRLDGGDVLVVGRTVYVGLSTRTNDDAVRQLEGALVPLGYSVRPLSVTGALHLKTAVTALRPDLMVLNPRWVDVSAFGGVERLVVDPKEPLSANVLRVKGTVFVPAAHPRLAEALASRGFAVVRLEIGELAKAEAGLTCMSVVIPVAASP